MNWSFPKPEVVAPHGGADQVKRLPMSASGQHYTWYQPHSHCRIRLSRETAHRNALAAHELIPRFASGARRGPKLA